MIEIYLPDGETLVQRSSLDVTALTKLLSKLEYRESVSIRVPLTEDAIRRIRDQDKSGSILALGDPSHPSGDPSQKPAPNPLAS